VLTLRREHARLTKTRGETVVAIARNRGVIAQLNTERLRLSATRREHAETELRDLAVQLAELQERIGSAQERLARVDLRAPMAGIVHDLQITSLNAVLRPAEPVLYVKKWELRPGLMRCMSMQCLWTNLRRCISLPFSRV
jgi:HlyD family secretion protein